jgi:hypothetical protein
MMDKRLMTGHHGDIGLPKVLKNFNIIYKKDERVFEKHVRTFNYLSALTIFEKISHSNYILVDILEDV